MQNIAKFIMISVSMVLLLAACDQSLQKQVKINDILTSPSAYDGRIIKIKGKVVDIIKIPLVENKIYILEDESGRIPVLTESNVPALNRVIKIKGSVDSVAILGAQSLGTHIREVKKLY